MIVLVAVSYEDARDYITLWPKLLSNAYVVTTIARGEGLRCSRVFVTDYAAENEGLVRPLEQSLALGSYNNDEADRFPIYLHMTYLQRLSARRLQEG